MAFRLSKAFYLKITILLVFLIASLVVSFVLGRNFGYFLMGDIQKDEKLKAVVEQASDSDQDYSPLVSSRFKFNPDEFPQNEFRDYIAERPDESDVLAEAARVEMKYAGSSETARDLFDLAENTENPDSSGEEESKTKPASGLIHKVHVGTFQNRESADNLCNLLRQDNYQPYIEVIVENNVKHYRVQIGAFADENNANNLAEELRKKGYHAWTWFTKR